MSTGPVSYVVYTSMPIWQVKNVKLIEQVTYPRSPAGHFWPIRYLPENLPSIAWRALLNLSAEYLVKSTP